jgi:Tetratricopeptide repeat
MLANFANWSGGREWIVTGPWRKLPLDPIPMQPWEPRGRVVWKCGSGCTPREAVHGIRPPQQFDQGRHADRDLFRPCAGDCATGRSDSTRHLNRRVTLAELYREQEDYAGAEPLFRRAVAIIEKTSGAENSIVGTLLNTLAWLDTAQGRYADAEPLCCRSAAAATSWRQPSRRAPRRCRTTKTRGRACLCLWGLQRVQVSRRPQDA